MKAIVDTNVVLDVLLARAPFAAAAAKLFAWRNSPGLTHASAPPL